MTSVHKRILNAHLFCFKFYFQGLPKRLPRFINNSRQNHLNFWNRGEVFLDYFNFTLLSEWDLSKLLSDQCHNISKHITEWLFCKMSGNLPFETYQYADDKHLYFSPLFNSLFNNQAFFFFFLLYWFNFVGYWLKHFLYW